MRQIPDISFASRLAQVLPASCSVSPLLHWQRRDRGIIHRRSALWGGISGAHVSPHARADSGAPPRSRVGERMGRVLVRACARKGSRQSRRGPASPDPPPPLGRALLSPARHTHTQPAQRTHHAAAAAAAAESAASFPAPPTPTPLPHTHTPSPPPPSQQLRRVAAAPAELHRRLLPAARLGGSGSGETWGQVSR